MSCCRSHDTAHAEIFTDAAVRLVDADVNKVICSSILHEIEHVPLLRSCPASFVQVASKGWATIEQFTKGTCNQPTGGNQPSGPPQSIDPTAAICKERTREAEALTRPLSHCDKGTVFTIRFS